MRSAEEAAQAQLEAYNRRDLDGFAAAYAPEVVLARLPSGEAFVRSRDELRARYGALFRDAPELHCKLLARLLKGRFVVDHEEVTGLPGRPLTHAVAIYEVEQGLIHRGWFLD